MIYLTRKLDLPSGEQLSRYVVCVDEGVVAWWTPFRTECQSMLFVDELVLSSSPCLQSVYANKMVGSGDEGELYLYEVKPGGELVRLY